MSNLWILLSPWIMDPLLLQQFTLIFLLLLLLFKYIQKPIGTRFSLGTLSLLRLYILVIEKGKATLGLKTLIFTNKDNEKAVDLRSVGMRYVLYLQRTGFQASRSSKFSRDYITTLPLETLLPTLRTELLLYTL